VGIIVQEDVAFLAFDQSEDIDVVVHVDHFSIKQRGGGKPTGAAAAWRGSAEGSGRASSFRSVTFGRFT
jgi:hypothetical protein